MALTKSWLPSLRVHYRPLFLRWRPRIASEYPPSRPRIASCRRALTPIAFPLKPELPLRSRGIPFPARGWAGTCRRTVRKRPSTAHGPPSYAGRVGRRGPGIRSAGEGFGSGGAGERLFAGGFAAGIGDRYPPRDAFRDRLVHGCAKSPWPRRWSNALRSRSCARPLPPDFPWQGVPGNSPGSREEGKP